MGPRLALFGILVPFMLVDSVASIECLKDCLNPDYTNPNFRPQECSEECSEELEALLVQEKNDVALIPELEAKVDKLLALVIGLTVLVATLLILFVLFFIKNSKLSSALLKSWRKTKHHTNVKITADRNGARIANYSTQQSPLSFRNRNSIAETNVKQIPLANPADHLPTKPRTRKPSEATCPEEPETVNEAAYDNLALSTSTLNGQSRPSSPASQSPSSPVSNPSASLATLNTTMTTIQIDSLPQRNEAARRTTP